MTNNNENWKQVLLSRSTHLEPSARAILIEEIEAVMARGTDYDTYAGFINAVAQENITKLLEAINKHKGVA